MFNEIMSFACWNFVWLEFYEGNGSSFLLYIQFDLDCQILRNTYDFSKNKYYILRDHFRYKAHG